MAFRPFSCLICFFGTLLVLFAPFLETLDLYTCLCLFLWTLTDLSFWFISCFILLLLDMTFHFSVDSSLLFYLRALTPFLQFPDTLIRAFCSTVLFRPSHLPFPLFLRPSDRALQTFRYSVLHTNFLLPLVRPVCLFFRHGEGSCPFSVDLSTCLS